MATDKQCKEFIEKIAPLIQKYSVKYGIKVVSAIIAQACLESAYGTSFKAKYHNYFGLKYRKNRVTCHSGYFKDGSKEQNKNGSYTPISTDWYAFSSMEKGVEGYFQFINTTNYKNVKGVTDPEKYLTNLKNDDYATSKTYVKDNMAVIKKWNLTKYDTKDTKYYRVQVGAYSKKSNAESMQKKIKTAGFDCIIKTVDGLYKCQVGAYSAKANADVQLNKIKKAGFAAFITYC